MGPETRIERSIQEWCAINDIAVWKIKSQGTFDPRRKQFLAPKSTSYFKRGVSDLIGIWKGLPLAIEVKSKTGKLSIHQQIFLETWQRAGGISIVARSVDDVKRVLNQISSGGVYHLLAGGIHFEP